LLSRKDQTVVTAAIAQQMHRAALVSFSKAKNTGWILTWSEYGQCGAGAYCLGGCDPKYSNALDSCVPEPVCQNKNLQFTSTDNIAQKKDYLGDPTKADWVADGDPQEYNSSVLLTMSEDSAGTVLASTVYVWYGKITASMRTSRGAGVVTAFILLSDVKDEIDFEFVGVDLQTAQTNYYSQGVTDCK
jgi:beta-glucanase (GH16 family)